MDTGLLRTLNLSRLNSATKYPSILTYHALGQKGRLTDEIQVPFELGEKLFLSEKVDGTNTRIIMGPDGEFIVGSRNDLLWYSEDLLHNPAQDIVKVLKANILKDFGSGLPWKEDHFRVYWGESYGGKITGQSKQYTKAGNTDFRLFDVAEFTADQLAEVLSWDEQKISGWRERGGQPFWESQAIEQLDIPVTPRLEFEGTIPTDHQEVLDWMVELLPETQCKLDETGLGEPEGIIVRNEDRSRIAKIRYPDYRRTLHQRQKRR